MNIKERIKKLLSENNFKRMFDDYRNRLAKINNLSHVGYGNWKNPAGQNFTWDDIDKKFTMVPAKLTFKDHVAKEKETEKPVDDYEIKVSGDDYRNNKMISKNWALTYSDYGNRQDFEVYGDLENIGKRGKKVNSISLSLYQRDPQQRTAWGRTIQSKIEQLKPKSVEEVTKIIEDIYQKMKEQDNGSTLNKYPHEHKGVDDRIPDFGLEGDYEDAQGEIVGVHFKKPDIRFSSKVEKSGSENGHMISDLSVKWAHVKKVDKIKDQLKAATGFDSVMKILRDNGIKYDYYSRMDPQYQ